MLRKVINSTLGNFGLELRKQQQASEKFNPFTGYDYGADGYKAVMLSKDYSMMPHINLFTLFEQAVYCEKQDIPGAFVECGVWKGGAVGIMAQANMQFGKQRRPLHLFDAFDDICAPIAEVDGRKAVEDTKKYSQLKSEEDMKGQLQPLKGAYDAFGGHGTIGICRDLLERKIGYPADHTFYHKGWFQDTVPADQHQIGDIAILRLDGDWYESIKICLDHLYDKVVKGGLVVIDDYGYYEGCTKAVDEFLHKRNIKTFLSYSFVGCRYFVKP